MSYKLNLIENIDNKALIFNQKTNTDKSFTSIGYPKACHFTDNEGNKVMINQKAGGRIRAQRRVGKSWGVIKFEVALNTIDWSKPMTDVKGNVYEV